MEGRWQVLLRASISPCLLLSLLLVDSVHWGVLLNMPQGPLDCKFWWKEKRLFASLKSFTKHCKSVFEKCTCHAVSTVSLQVRQGRSSGRIHQWTISHVHCLFHIFRSCWGQFHTTQSLEVLISLFSRDKRTSGILYIFIAIQYACNRATRCVLHWFFSIFYQSVFAVNLHTLFVSDVFVCRFSECLNHQKWSTIDCSWYPYSGLSSTW